MDTPPASSTAPRRLAVLGTVAFAALVLIATAVFGHQPSSGIYENGTAEAAVITIGAPQVYARETLINDRRQEIEYLSKLIKESEDRDFAPQITRDLSTLAKVRAVLDISAGATPDLPEQSTSTTTSLAPIAPTTGAPELSTEVSPPAAPTVPTDIDKSSEPRRTLTGISPLDEFRDRQVYRAELRAALAAVSLDDLHDFGGNALYRLQFNATILPGATKAKYGVAKLVVRRPRVTKADIESLYYTWINHVGRRLNPGSVYKGGTDNTVLRDFYLAVGDVTQAFRPLMFCYANCRNKKEREPILLPVPVLPSKALQDLMAALGLDENGELGTGDAPGVYALLDALAGLRNAVPSQKTERVTVVPGCVVLGLKDSFKDQATAANVLVRAHAARMMATALLGLTRNSLGEARYLPDKLYRLQSAGTQVRSHLLANALDKSECAHTLERDYAPIPDAFLTALLVDPNCFRTMAFREGSGTKSNPPRCIYDGNAFAYGTTPVELGQRVSSSVSLARSLELALAASATLSQHTGAKQNLEWMQNTAEKIERTDRLPLTIGYSTRTEIQLTDEFKDLTPEFGWVFGPGLRANMNASGLELSQIPRSEALTADLSVPTWWPFLKLEVQTAWIENWNRSTKPLADTTEGNQHYIEVRFPKKAADLDLVTQRLLAGDVTTSTAGRQPFVERVRPNDISICAGEVTFVIQGTNIWRGTNVFLGGVKAKSVAVLPDMEGIVAEFDMSGTHAQHRRDTRKLVLSIATRNGSTEIDIPVTAAEGVQNCATTSFLSAPRK